MEKAILELIDMIKTAGSHKEKADLNAHMARDEVKVLSEVNKVLERKNKELTEKVKHHVEDNKDMCNYMDTLKETNNSLCEQLDMAEGRIKELEQQVKDKDNYSEQNIKLVKEKAELDCVIESLMKEILGHVSDSEANTIINDIYKNLPNRKKS